MEPQAALALDKPDFRQIGLQLDGVGGSGFRMLFDRD